MKRALERIASCFEAIVERIGSAGVWLVFALVLTVCADVFFRYVLNRSNMAIQELEWHLCAATFLICTAWTLRHDRHVRVDVCSSKFSDKAKAITTIFGVVFMLLPFVVTLVWTAWPFALNSWHLRESSSNPGGLPARYVLKFLIPVSAILLGMQGVAMAIRAMQVLLGCAPEAVLETQEEDHVA
jgi:TRAP-type mannitol/chloroaromatic compound transport system permease small subunit